MSGGRISAATERALAMVDAGQTAYSAARECGIDTGTLYRALARRDGRVAVEIKMSTEQRAKMRRLGGGPWVRKMIDEARES